MGRFALQQDRRLRACRHPTTGPCIGIRNLMTLRTCCSAVVLPHHFGPLICTAPTFQVTESSVRPRKSFQISHDHTFTAKIVIIAASLASALRFCRLLLVYFVLFWRLLLRVKLFDPRFHLKNRRTFSGRGLRRAQYEHARTTAGLRWGEGCVPNNCAAKRRYLRRLRTANRILHPRHSTFFFSKKEK